MWIDASKELPPQTKGEFSDFDVLVTTLYHEEVARTKNGEWVTMKNEPLENVVLWMRIPPIPEELHSCFGLCD